MFTELLQVPKYKGHSSLAKDGLNIGKMAILKYIK